MRTIKRYHNRKLYESLERKYLVLKDIVNFIREGEEFIITDHLTNEDITDKITLRAICSANLNEREMNNLRTIFTKGEAQ